MKYPTRLNGNSETGWSIVARSAEDALCQGLERTIAQGEREESRAGPVLVAPCPVTTTMVEPMRRVLRAPWRDANPFFHLVEAAWMLAGRDDVASLVPYVKRFADFAEDDGAVHGAYGERWRSAFGFDQLKFVVEKLRAEPLTRQCVVAMWDPGDSNDLRAQVRDRPCNTHIYLRQRQPTVGWAQERGGDREPLKMTVLDMTVCCRSNDLVWGAHGANAVHFSFLHEYLASAAGSALGVLRQFSNNYHVYTAELERLQAHSDFLVSSDDQLPAPVSMGSAGDVDADLPQLWRVLYDLHSRGEEALPSRPGEVCTTPFAQSVLAAAVAYRYHRRGERSLALHVCDHITMPDWQMACREWLGRRARV